MTNSEPSIDDTCLMLDRAAFRIGAVSLSMMEEMERKCLPPRKTPLQEDSTEATELLTLVENRIPNVHDTSLSADDVAQVIRHTLTDADLRDVVVVGSAAAALRGLGPTVGIDVRVDDPAILTRVAQRFQTAVTTNPAGVMRSSVGRMSLFHDPAITGPVRASLRLDETVINGICLDWPLDDVSAKDVSPPTPPHDSFILRGQRLHNLP